MAQGERGPRGYRGKTGAAGERGPAGEGHSSEGPRHSRFVNGPSAPVMKWLKLHPWTVLAFCVFAAIAYTYIVGHRTDEQIKAVQERQTLAGKQNRRELCESIDADHNRQREDILRNEKLLYAVPEFKALIPTLAAEKIAYESAKRRYLAIRKTRPSFCGFVSNPVPPFPSLADFRRTPPDKRSSGDLADDSARPAPLITVAPRPVSAPHRKPQTPSRSDPPPSATNPPSQHAGTPQAPPNPRVPDRVCLPDLRPLPPVCAP